MNKEQAINILLDYANKKEVSNDALTSAILFLENEREKNKIDNKSKCLNLLHLIHRL